MSTILLALLMSSGMAAAASGEAVVGPPEPPRFLGARTLALVAEHIDGVPFRIPQGVYYDDGSDEVFVADSGSGLIGIYDGRGIPKFTFSTGPGAAYPVAVTTDTEGHIYVLEAGGSVVKVFNYRGEPVRDIDLGVVERTKVAGTGMAMGKDGRLYLLDAVVGRIVIYECDGTYVRVIRGSGKGGTRLQAPGDLAFDAAGNLYVSDRRGMPIQVYDSSGRYLRGWGKHDIGAEGFSAPAGIAVDAWGNVLVADPLRQDVKVFDQEGNFQERFGGFGRRPGDLAYPTDVAVGSGNRFYVVERVGARLQVFERNSLSDGPNRAAVPPVTPSPKKHSP